MNINGVLPENYSGTVYFPAMIWIPASNPPEPGTECLVCTKYGYIYIEKYYKGAFHCIDDAYYGFEDNNVTHWMPLPKPPIIAEK